MTASKLSLPDVTLVAVDTRCHELARLAVLDCMAQVDFAEVLICSDRDLEISNTKFFRVVDWPDKDSANTFLWCDLPSIIRTSRFLFCEWDAWVLDGSRFDPQFLHCDFIGAPWSWLTINNVGNGGFSMRSTRLARHVADNADQYPIRYPFVWDELLCQEYRPRLEAEGFVWASERLARQFAFETRHDMFDTFGFHAMYNWPMVLSGDRLKKRVTLARANDHVRRTQWQHLTRLPC